MKRYLAADFGAGSGRVIVGTPSAEGIQLEEIHRFENNQKMIDCHLRWDFNALLNELKTGLKKAFAKYGWGWGGNGWGQNSSGREKFDFMHFSIQKNGG